MPSRAGASVEPGDRAFLERPSRVSAGPAVHMTLPIRAVVFDLDGVLVDTEPWWYECRVETAEAAGGRWTAADEAAVKGASSPEWAAAMAAELARQLPVAPEAGPLETEVVDRMVARYRSGPVPAIEPGVRAARRLALRWPLAVASSAHGRVIDAALGALGLAHAFAVVLSSDSVGVGKPAPDVYLEVARRLGVEPSACLVVEDSLPGVRAALGAGMRVVLVPAAGHPPARAADALATLVLPTLDRLDDAVLAGLEAVAPPG